MERESFIFYRSFYDAMADISDKDKLKLYDAICKYALYNEETKLTGIASTLFKLIKPQLEANNKRFEDGKKGGRPKKETTGFEDKKTTGYKKEKITGFEKIETNGYENKKPNVNVNDNVNYNVNENVNVNVNVNYDDYKDIYNHLGLDELADKYPEQEEQVAFYIRCLNKMIEQGLEYIVRNADIETLSLSWIKTRGQINVIDKESYFIEVLKNEVEKCL